MNYHSHAKLLGVLSVVVVSFCVALVQFNPVTASASSDCWTTVGSAGTVDEADSQIVALDQNNVSIKASVESGTVNIRYNVSGVQDNINDIDNDKLVLTLRYLDNGANAHVVARLKRVNLNTGTISVLASFDSDNFPQSGASQTQSVSSACFSPNPFDSDTNAYFLDVEISRSAFDGFAALRAARVCVDDCP